MCQAADIELALRLSGVRGFNFKIDADSPFMTLGLDSLQMIDVKSRLDLVITAASPGRGRPLLSSTSLFDFPTPRRLLQHIGATMAEEGVAIVGMPRSFNLYNKKAIVDKGAAAAAADGVAIVGMSCRLPGGCRTPALFWEAR